MSRAHTLLSRYRALFRYRSRCYGVYCLLASGAAASALSLVACSDQSNPLPSGTGSTASSVAAGLTAKPQGPFPRGTKVDPRHLPDPATIGPELRILSPTPDAQATATTVDVRVEAKDGDGVQEVLIAGSPATHASGDEYVATVALVPGFNLITIDATDARGNLTTSHVTVVQGQFAPIGQFLDQRIAASFTHDGLRRAADVAEDQTKTVNLYSLLAHKNPIVNTSALKVNALALRHDPMKFSIQGQPSGIEITVDLDHPEFDVDVNVIGIALTRALLTADRATAVVRATVNRSAITGPGPRSQALGLQVDSLDVTFLNFRATAATGFVNTLVGPFMGLIEGAVRDELEGVLIDLVDDTFNGGLAGFDSPINIPLSLSGNTTTASSLDLQFQIDQADGFPNAGLGVVGALKAEGHGPTLPGASQAVYVTGTTLQPRILGPERFAVSLSSDALNHLLHALYLTDALRYELDGTNPAPGSTLSLSAKLLYPFLPPVRDLAPDPDTPVSIEIKIASAPIAAFGKNPTAPFEASIGELELTVWIDYMDGQPRLELFTLRAAATVEAHIAVDAQEIKISKLDVTGLRVDVIREPAADLADQEIETFVHGITPWVMDQYVKDVPGLPIPALPLGLQLGSPRIDVQPDVLTIQGDL